MKLADRTFRKGRGTGSDQYYITSPFGWRKDPISGEYSGHNGCDYGTHGEKWAQYALEDGVVESVYLDAWGAKCIRIRYDRLGYRCTYAHLDRTCVVKGQVVNKDTVIGYTGTTGKSTGIHLHLGVQRIGESTWIDPESLDYTEAPVPSSDGFPYNAKIKKGSPLFRKDGTQYPNGTSVERSITVQGEVNGRFEIYGSTFTPHVVYCNKEDIVGYNGVPTEITLRKGDRVIITGTGNGSSNGNANTAYGIGWEREIMNIWEGRAYPYQVGQDGVTIGFYKASALRRK